MERAASTPTMSTVKSVTTLAIIFAFLSTRRMLAESYRRISAARNCVTFVTMGGEDAPKDRRRAQSLCFCLSRARALNAAAPETAGARGHPIVNDKRVERIWRREGLKVPAKQSKQGRIWLADGSCIRLRAERPNHVWSYDFVEDRTHEGRKYRMLNLIDEFTHECLAIRVDRKLKSADVIGVLSDQFMLRGVPEHVRSDNGPEFVAKAVQDWIRAVGAKTAYIERGSPWENGFIESFNARLRDELLDGEIFYSLAEARIVIESWRRHYNTERPHGSLGYKPPAPEVFIPAFAARAAPQPRPATPPALADRPTMN